jgi:TonB family protein
MRQSITVSLVVVLAVLGMGSTFAQSTAPGARLERATANSTLASPDLKPWHLKLDVTVFDEKGKDPHQGTVEAWQSGADSRTVYTFGASSSTQLYHDAKFYRISNGSDVPYRASEVLQQFLHPGVRTDEMTGATPDLRKVDFGKTTLECIMLSQPIKRLAYAPLGLFPTYCLEPGSDRLRASYDFATRAVIRNGMGKFLDREVTTSLTLMEGPVVVATGKVLTLTTYSPQPDEFVPTAEMKLSIATARISGGIVAGMNLKKVAPIYPEAAKGNRVSGTVILRAIIGRDGHVYALRPVSSPDPDLALSAIAAVSQWTYKPYLLNGEPTEVDTTIVVNYNINP